MALATYAKSQSEPAMDQARFCALWERCAMDADAVDTGDAVFAELLTHYREPHRYYHTPDHIRHCLQQYDLARDEMNDPDAVELALWFHDVIYDTPAHDNESRSADLFAEVARGKLPDELIERVYAMIMITVHPSEPSDTDQQLVADIDLSSFALPWDRFKRDSEAVRREMRYLNDKEFFAAQIRFLQSLLNRDSFFGSRYFNRRSETAACENVARYLAELRDKGFADDA